MVTRLVTICDEYGWHLRLMEYVEREHTLLLAMAREIIESRKTASAGTFTREAVEESARKHGLLEETGS